MYIIQFSNNYKIIKFNSFFFCTVVAIIKVLLRKNFKFQVVVESRDLFRNVDLFIEISIKNNFFLKLLYC